MAQLNGTNANEVLDISSWGPPVLPATAHGVNAYGGDDTIYGSAYIDNLFGGDGNDTIYGNAGDDLIFGGNGNDTSYGGSGNDTILDAAGDDSLWGQAGNDTLWGGVGNDTYIFTAGDGIDTINDDKSPTGAAGYGGGTDLLYFGYNASQLYLFQSGNDFLITTIADASDGVMNEGVVIQDFFLGGNNVVEYLQTADNGVYDLTQVL